MVSSTLVSVEDRGYLLTAGHVLVDLREARHGVVVHTHRALVEGKPFVLPRRARLAVVLERAKRETNFDGSFVLGVGDDDDPWTPDLAFIALPEVVLDALLYGGFYLYALSLESLALTIPKGLLWTVAGHPEQWSAPGQTNFVFMESQVEERRPKRMIPAAAGVDFVDVIHKPKKAPTDLDGPLTSPEGMSGAGLWYAPFDDEGRRVADVEPSLRGVCYRLIPKPGDRADLRCHGPRALAESLRRMRGA